MVILGSQAPPPRPASRTSFSSWPTTTAHPGVGCYGGAYQTPNLDALAAGGLRFTHGYSMPLCAPTRGVIVSGRYPFRNGVRDNGAGGNYKPSDSPSIAAMLKSAATQPPSPASGDS